MSVFPLTIRSLSLPRAEPVAFAKTTETNRIFRTLSKNTVRSSCFVWANLKEGSIEGVKKQICAILGILGLNKGGNFEKTTMKRDQEI